MQTQKYCVIETSIGLFFGSRAFLGWTGQLLVRKFFLSVNDV